LLSIPIATYCSIKRLFLDYLLSLKFEPLISVIGITQLGTEKVIVKIRGMSIGKAFDNAERAGLINVVEVRDFDQTIEMLAISRVDLVACIDYISNSSLERLQLRDKIATIILSTEKRLLI